MDYKLLVETAVLAGEIMLSGGAETYRVEDTINRMLRVSKLKTSEAFATTTCIMVTLSDPNIDTISHVKRIGCRSTNLNKVYLVNNVSRNWCSGKITLQEAHNELIEIKESKHYNPWLYYLSNIGTAGFFAVLLGGNGYDFVFAAINGLIVSICLYFSDRIRINTFITNVITATLIAICSMLFIRSFPDKTHMDLLISGSIMPLVPGVAITNAIRDTLHGDYMSGGSRAIEAFVLATSIAVGIGVGLGLFQSIV